MIDMGIGQIQKQRNFHEFCVHHNNMTIRLPHTYTLLFFDQFCDGLFKFCDLIFQTEKIILRCNL